MYICICTCTHIMYIYIYIYMYTDRNPEQTFSPSAGPTLP